MFGFEALYSERIEIRDELSNEKDKYMKTRPGGLVFFWPLFILFCSLHMYHMLLAKQHKNQSKISTSKCKVYFATVPNFAGAAEVHSFDASDLIPARAWDRGQ